jgi:FkbM family methyltransferase
MMGWHSQKDEDFVIAKSVEHIQNGRYLDIGAFDGINYSNTWALTEQRGWSGIMVEAGLHAFLKLLENHELNDKLTLVHAAIGVGKSGLQPFWENHATFSTTLASNRDRFHFEGFSPQFYTPVVSMAWLFEAFPGPIDVLSIDTEGTSVDLFKAFTAMGCCKPRCICVEHDGRVDEVLAHAAMYGYHQIMGNEENCVLETA